MHTHRSEQQSGRNAARSKQRGIVLPLFVAAMTAILVMAGLALDMSHVMLNKSRLQNVADAAALAGAKKLDETGNMALARAAAISILTDNTATDGNGELAADVDISADVVIQFSSTLTPFSADGNPPFIRVQINDFSMDAWIIQLLGSEFAKKTIKASAVSGPSPTLGEVCDLAPFIVCEYPGAGGPDFGYTRGDINVLKGSSQTGGTQGPIGGGNFFLAALDDETGGSTLADNAAGAYEGCLTVGDDILTETGNKRAPTSATNTRIGCPSGTSNCGGGIIDRDKYMPDVITTEPTGDLTSEDGTMKVFLGDGPDKVLLGDSDPEATDRGAGAEYLDFNYEKYQEYRGDESKWQNPPPAGAFDRRNLTVIVADCDGKNDGRNNLPVVGFGCYFMLQEIAKGGNEDELYGQFVGGCEASGNVGPEPTTDPGPTKIILYKDSGSIDS